MNVSGEFNPFDKDWALNFYSAGATLSVTVNASEETVGTIARLNNLDFTADNIAGLNDVSSNYRLTLKRIFYVMELYLMLQICYYMVKIAYSFLW